MTEKQCKRCNVTKPISEFRIHKNGKPDSWCKPCEAKASREWEIKNPKGYLVIGARARAKTRGLECTITADDFEMPEVCPVIGIKLQRTKGKTSDNSPTLDRIDTSKGYVKGNVEVISHKANKMKSDASREEILSFIKYYEKKLN